MTHAIHEVATPLGPYAVRASQDGLTHVRPAGHPDLPAASEPSDAALALARRGAAALEAYFAGVHAPFDGLPLAPTGTDFQQRVWSALREIPHGCTESYGEIARRIGSPGAARAVGSANHENPLAIVVPCHRVVGANGHLTGYAGGLDRKRWLLAHEGSETPELALAGASA